MNKSDYLELLEKGYTSFISWYGDASKYTYLSSYVFEFTTYDSFMDELLVTKAMEVAMSINSQTNFTYIENEENYKWYIIIVNMYPFCQLLEWGASVRGAWWSYNSKIKFPTIQLDDKNYEMTREDWINLIYAVDKFLDS